MLTYLDKSRSITHVLRTLAHISLVGYIRTQYSSVGISYNTGRYLLLYEVLTVNRCDTLFLAH